MNEKHQIQHKKRVQDTKSEFTKKRDQKQISKAPAPQKPLKEEGNLFSDSDSAFAKEVRYRTKDLRSRKQNPRIRTKTRSK